MLQQSQKRTQGNTFLVKYGILKLIYKRMQRWSLSAGKQLGSIKPDLHFYEQKLSVLLLLSYSITYFLSLWGCKIAWANPGE